MRGFGPDLRRASRVGSVILAFLLGSLANGCGGADDPFGGDGGSKGRRPPPTRGDGGAGGEGAGGSGTGGTGGVGGSGGAAVPALRVTAVRPPRGSIDGGASVLVEGAGFVLTAGEAGKPTDVTEVYFGDNAAIGARVIDDDTILVTTPPGAEGDVDVVVRNPSGEAVCAGCYRYQAPVDLQGIEPAEGPIHGGIAITLRGAYLRGSMQVLIGNRAALDVEAQPDGSLRAILPPGDVAGSVDVRVYDADGQDWMRKAFTYVAPLRIDQVDPPGGPVAGGNTIVLSGSGFTAGSEVFVGGTRANAQLLPDGTLRLAVPPAAAPGATTIEVRTPSGSAFAPYGYFDPAETEVRLFALSPATGPVAGGTRMVLVGSNLDRGNLALRFGGSFAEDATALSSNIVEATLPPGAAPGPVDVDVRVTGGQDVLPGGFTYVHAIEVDAVTPGSGPVDGGTTITITGSGFPPGARVFVGALEATGVERLGPDTLRAITPRGTDGPVPVRVVHPDDESIEGMLRGGFAYDGPFSVARIDPSTGSQSGGTRVIARGSGFGPGLGAAFGNGVAQTIEVLDPFTAVVYTPRGSPGTVDVRFDEGAETTTLEAAFTYYDPSDSGGGSSGGPLNGTLNVTVLDDGPPPRRGLPLPGVLVVVGTESDTPLQGFTDDRGQITFSDPSLVKAQTVSAALEGYQSTTVVGQASENLTILLEPNQELPPCANGVDDDGDGLIDEEDVNGCACGPHNYEGLENPPPPELCMCANPLMPVETNFCCDGIDNDGDGLIDAEDPDCQCSGGISEGPLPQCSNCIDDDGDGRIDFNNPNFLPDSGCASASDTEDGVIVAGRVWGFKLPGGRTLGPDEVEEAHVRITVPGYFFAPPIGNAQAPIVIANDGGSYAYEFPNSRLLAVYAIYGVRNLVTNEFEPLLLGVRRNVNATPGKDITNADIILDTHLSMEVPVTIENPPIVSGIAGTTSVFAYVDLGAEGWFPIGQSTTDQAASAVVSRLPPLTGENLAFHAQGHNPLAPNSLVGIFRTQAGDVSQGITIGPMMGMTRIVQPSATETFDGVIEWIVEDGPPADVTVASIFEMTLTGPILQWQIVVPGTETRVTVPPQVLDRLREKFGPGMQLLLNLQRGREPRFKYEQWSYENLGIDRFSGFTVENAIITL